MRYLYITLLAVLMGGIAAQAQTADYQPLVREGVVWHYARVFLDMPNEEESTMFFEGDSVVNEIVYKKCITVSSDGSRQVVALMREQDKVVYSIGGANYAVESCEGLYNGEIILYDFSNPKSMFRDDWSIEWEVTAIDIDGVPHNCYTNDNGNNKIIEGIGLDGSGTLTDLYFDILTSTHYLYTGLSYVERDGKIIYKGSAYEAPPYQPLVREGVVWHYAYDVVDEGGTGYFIGMVDHKLQFKGDTIIDGVQYKKGYLYDTEELDPSNVIEQCFGREANRQVFFINQYSSFSFNILPSGSPEGEFQVYDFADMIGFIDKVTAYEQNDRGHVAYPLQYDSTTITMVGDKEVQKHCLSTPIIIHNPFYYVEGVGYDAKGTGVGYLYSPFIDIATCYCSSPQGLIKLTDLEGNVLYKGQMYDEYNLYSSVGELKSGNMSLQTQIQAGSLRVIIPDDGMLSVMDTSGHVVENRVVCKGVETLSTESLCAGVYIIQLATPRTNMTTKVVVK